MNKNLRKCLNFFSDILFPGSCPVCKGETFKDGLSYMCKECEESLAWINKEGCKYCGIPMSGYDFNGLTCASCRLQTPNFLSGKSLFLLDQKGKRVIHKIKYSGVKDVLKDISSWLNRSPSFKSFLQNSILIPVPLHKKRLAKRGFNQSAWIAHALSKGLGDNVGVVDALERIRDTPTQTNLDRRQRIKNVKNAFALIKKNSLCYDQKIVLIDDVYTTGATLNECANALKSEGFVNVNVATLGHG